MAEKKVLGRLLYGRHVVVEALRTGARVDTLYLARGLRGGRRIEELARGTGAAVKRVDGRALDRLADGGVHQGVAARVTPRPALDLESFLDRTAGRPRVTVLALDGVQDPRNLGAAVRSCSLAGAAAVLLPRARSAAVTPAAEKAAAGAFEHVDVVHAANLAAALRRLKEAGFWIWGADAAGETPLPEADFTERTVVVMGGEHRGLRRLTREHCDHLVRIPQAGPLGSYNVAVAAGIFLFWIFLRPRVPPPPG